MRKRLITAIVVTVVAAGSIVCFTAAKVRRNRAAIAALSVDFDRTNVEGVVFAVRPTGFNPPEVNLAKGRYLFIVQNRSGIRDLTFQLDREAGERLHEVHDQKLQWKKIFDLNPGTYMLTVAGHPEWRSVITVRDR